MNTEEVDERTLVLHRSYEASPEQVFKAWTDADDLKRWYAPVEGWVVSRAEVDLRPGGRYHIEFGPPGGEPIVEIGVYEEIVPGQLLIFNIDLEGRDAAESTKVRVEFVEVGGRTELTITEGKYSTKEVRDMHARGWSRCLDLLSEVVKDRSAVS